MDDAEEIIKAKKTAFEAWSMMVFMSGSEKRNYGELIHDFSIQHTINNDQYSKTLQEALDVMHN